MVINGLNKTNKKYESKIIIANKKNPAKLGIINCVAFLGTLKNG